MNKTNNTNTGQGQNLKLTTENIWLHYYNDYLYEQGVITEAERRKMDNLIENRNHTISKDEPSR